MPRPRSWTICVVTQDVIERIHGIAQAQPSSEIGNDPIFVWSPSNIISDLDDIEGAQAYTSDVHQLKENQEIQTTIKST